MGSPEWIPNVPWRAPRSSAREHKLTFLSMGLKTLSLPKRTWKGEQASSTPPSVVGRSTTITSMAPVSVAGLMSL